MKDLTAFGGSGRKQIRNTDSDQVLKDRAKSDEFRKGMKPYNEIPGYGDPEPQSEENQSSNN